MLMWIILADGMTATAPKWFTIGNDFRNDLHRWRAVCGCYVKNGDARADQRWNQHEYRKEEDTKQSKSEMRRIEPTA